MFHKETTVWSIQMRSSDRLKKGINYNDYNFKYFILVVEPHSCCRTSDIFLWDYCSIAIFSVIVKLTNVKPSQMKCIIKLCLIIQHLEYYVNFVKSEVTSPLDLPDTSFYNKRPLGVVEFHKCSQVNTKHCNA